MIISHRKRFIFIKSRKTAGHSIHAALDSITGPADLVWRDGKSQNARGLKNIQHASAARAKEISGDAWQEYFKFTAIRNPWDIVAHFPHILFSISPNFAASSRSGHSELLGGRFFSDGGRLMFSGVSMDDAARALRDKNFVERGGISKKVTT